MAFDVEADTRDGDAPAPPAVEEKGARQRMRTAEAAPAAKPAMKSEPAAPPAQAAPPPTAPPAAPAKKGRPVRKLLLGAALLAALGLGGYEGYRWWTDGRFFVTTDDAYVQADITLIAAKVAGYVESVEVENNQAVKAGDVIARIEDGDYRLALQSAQGKLATQESTARRIDRQTAAAEAMVAQAAAKVESAKAEAVRTAADYVRQTELVRGNFASKARLDEAVASRDQAAAAVRSAQAAVAAEEANVEVLKAQRTEADRLADELRTNVAKAERDLSFTVIKAPLDGVIGNRAVQVGAYVQPAGRLAALVPLSSVHIDANFKETQLADIRPGQTVRLEIDALPGRDIQGRVLSIAPASGSTFSLLPPENATGNFTKIVQRVPVRVAVPPELAAQGLLRPGLSVVVGVDTRTTPEAVAAITR